MVSTHLKKIFVKLGSFPQVRVQKNTPASYYVCRLDLFCFSVENPCDFRPCTVCWFVVGSSSVPRINFIQFRLTAVLKSQAFTSYRHLLGVRISLPLTLLIRSYEDSFLNQKNFSLPETSPIAATIASFKSSTLW